MSTEQSQQPAGAQPPGDQGAFTQEIQHHQVTARVPERVSRGVFSTGAMVLQGPYEFVLDFMLRMNQPHQIVARVVMPLSLMPSLIAALRDNLAGYQGRFGAPLTMPTGPLPPKPPSIDEIYDSLKLPDDLLSGVYANQVMILHAPGEFCFEFITNFYPRSAIAARIFMSAPQIPVLLNTLARAWQQYQHKVLEAQAPPPNHEKP